MSDTLQYNNIYNISLRPSWLGKIDWAKGCGFYNSNTNSNNINIDNSNDNNDNNDSNDKDLELILNEIEDKANDNNGDKIINLKFLYYNEKTEFYKNNAVFLKPQYQNINTLEEYLKLINKNKNNNNINNINNSNNDNNNIDNEINFDTINTINPKNKYRFFSKYCLSSLLLSTGKQYCNTTITNNNITPINNSTINDKNKFSKINLNKNKINKNNNDNNNYYNSDLSDITDSDSEPDFNDNYNKSSYKKK
jgi:hypothetical protein